MFLRTLVVALAFWVAVLPSVCGCIAHASHAAAQTDSDTELPAHPGCHGHGDPDSVPTQGEQRQEDTLCCCSLENLYVARALSVDETHLTAVAVVRVQLPPELTAPWPIRTPAVVLKLLNSPFVRENPPLLI